MKRVFLVLLCAIFFCINTYAIADTTTFTASGEFYSNEVDPSSRCKKSTDGDKYFYVTVKDVWAYNSNDKIYFGPRRDLGNSYSGSLSNGLGWYSGQNNRQKRKYTKDAPGNEYYALNVKEHTSGPGALFILDVAWTP